MRRGVAGSDGPKQCGLPEAQSPRVASKDKARDGVRTLVPDRHVTGWLQA